MKDVSTEITSDFAGKSKEIAVQAALSLQKESIGIQVEQIQKQSQEKA